MINLKKKPNEKVVNMSKLTKSYFSTIFWGSLYDSPSKAFLFSIQWPPMKMIIILIKSSDVTIVLVIYAPIAV